MARLLEFILFIALSYGGFHYVRTNIKSWRYRTKMLRGIRVGDLIELADPLLGKLNKPPHAYVIRWDNKRLLLTTESLGNDPDPNTVTAEALNSKFFVDINEVGRNASFDTRREKAIEQARIDKMNAYMLR